MEYHINYNEKIYYFRGALCKLGKQEHLRSLQGGSIYMKRLDYFVNQARLHPDATPGMSDIEEGMLINFGNFSYSLKNMTSINIGKPYANLNVYIFSCMDTILTLTTKKEENFLNCSLDIKMQNFLDSEHLENYGLLFFSKKDFIERFSTIVDSQNIKAFHKKITYKDKIYTDLLDRKSYIEAYFRKRPSYECQNEYRFLVDMENHRADSEDSIKLEIGDISDISFYVPISSVHNE